VSIDPQMIVTEQVMDDDLTRPAVGRDRREHRTPWSTQKRAHRFDQLSAVSHALGGYLAIAASDCGLAPRC
jgi:hypothetical protein